MSGSDPQPLPALPPEVPEEFAAAYREAYERVLAEQSVEHHRRLADPEDPDELPRRSGRLEVGTHRSPAYSASRWERLGHKPWFVPLLLVLLALILVLLAYGVGRMFAERVRGPESASAAVVGVPVGVGCAARLPVYGAGV